MRILFEIERIRRKSDLINWLGWQLGYSSYLELASPTTGHQFRRISPAVFTDVHRVMYRLPPDYDDGMKIMHQTTSEDSTECLRPYDEQQWKFDLIFVDSFHTYESSRRDLELTFRLLKPGGILVVHDCNPTNREIASPQFMAGKWLGVTYLAFLDFVRDHRELEHCVVDTDHGCGVLRYRAEPSGAGSNGTAAKDPLLTQDYHDWDTFMTHRRELLNLVSVPDFLRRFRTRPPTLACRIYRTLTRSPIS